ncbi:MAG TPA: nickel pincer cofactor biosynthesis protein LarC [Ruminococcaceae bacterium]|mgnify:CR=1 FL=1|nr:nickel pincer cofactor biosynthesis protein LarC [Oscillospiraceae bacterium]
MKTLYLECYSGISGDMTVAALLDLGADKAALLSALNSLKIGGFEIKIGRANKNGIDACDFDVVLTDAHEHGHGCGDKEHHHRGINDIFDIIDNSDISVRAKQLAKDIFAVIAKAEAKIHGKPLEDVHFHEVGAVDSIVDIVGAAVCIDNLNIERVIASPLFEGTGYVRCQHGLLPVPAPATAEIFKEYSIPFKITQNNGEMVTPTGAAIVAALAQSFAPPEFMTIEKIGFGAGKKNFTSANVLRAMLINASDGSSDEIVKLECNIDDITGEQLGYAMEILIGSGANDCFYTPIFMKKNRPAYLLTVLCEPNNRENIIKLIFKHTTTIGIRTSRMPRIKMKRMIYTIDTIYGEVQIKQCAYDDIIKNYVEYETAKKLAVQNNVPVDDVFRAAYNAI